MELRVSSNERVWNTADFAVNFIKDISNSIEFDVNWIYSIRREIVGDELLSSNSSRGGWKLFLKEIERQREKKKEWEFLKRFQ